MDPFEDFEEILVQSRVKFANTQPKSQLERQNRPRTASWRTSSAAAATTSAHQALKIEPARATTTTTTTRSQTSTTAFDGQYLKQGNDTSNFYLGAESKQELRSRLGDGLKREEGEKVEVEVEARRGGLASVVIANTAPSSYSSSTAKVEKVEQLETVSEVSEELSVEWHEEQSGEKLSSGNNSNGSSIAKIAVKDGTEADAEAEVEPRSEWEGALERDFEDGSQGFGEAVEVGASERGEMLQLEDLVNLVSDLESPQSGSDQADGQLSEPDSSESQMRRQLEDRGENDDYIGPEKGSEKAGQLREESRLSGEFLLEGSITEDENETEKETRTRTRTQKWVENALKLIENKLEEKFDSFGDDLIRLLQEQFNFLMNSISQHIERIENRSSSPPLPSRKPSQNEESSCLFQEVATQIRGPNQTNPSKLEQNEKSGENVHYRGQTECNLVNDEKENQNDGGKKEKLKIVQESCSQLANGNNQQQNDRGSLLRTGNHHKSGSKSARVEMRRIENEIENENKREFEPLLEYYKRRLRQYNGIILITSICPKIPELSGSHAAAAVAAEFRSGPNLGGVEMQTNTTTTTGNRWRGKQYELLDTRDTCYRTSKFKFKANSLLTESRFASRQLESRRILLLNSIEQPTRKVASRTYLHLARPEQEA